MHVQIININLKAGDFMKLSGKSIRVCISISILIAICLLSLYFFKHDKELKIPERAIFVKYLTFKGDA